MPRAPHRWSRARPRVGSADHDVGHGPVRRHPARALHPGATLVITHGRVGGLVVRQTRRWAAPMRNYPAVPAGERRRPNGSGRLVPCGALRHARRATARRGSRRERFRPPACGGRGVARAGGPRPGWRPDAGSTSRSHARRPRAFRPSWHGRQRSQRAERLTRRAGARQASARRARSASINGSGLPIAEACCARRSAELDGGKRSVQVAIDVLEYLRKLDPGDRRHGSVPGGERAPRLPRLLQASNPSEQTRPLARHLVVHDARGPHLRQLRDRRRDAIAPVDEPRRRRRRPAPTDAASLWELVAPQPGSSVAIASSRRPSSRKQRASPRRSPSGASRRRSSSPSSSARWASSLASERTSRSLWSTTGTSGPALPPLRNVRYRPGISQPFDVIDAPESEQRFPRRYAAAHPPFGAGTTAGRS